MSETLESHETYMEMEDVRRIESVEAVMAGYCKAVSMGEYKLATGYRDRMLKIVADSYRKGLEEVRE